MSTSSHLLRWSTEMLPERTRFSTFREEFARLFSRNARRLDHKALDAGSYELGVDDLEQGSPARFALQLWIGKQTCGCDPCHPATPV